MRGGGAVFDIVGYSVIAVGGIPRANNVNGGTSPEASRESHVGTS
jgi:hypothetical protein